MPGLLEADRMARTTSRSGPTHPWRTGRTCEKPVAPVQVRYVYHPLFSLPGTEQQLWGLDQQENNIRPFQPFSVYQEESDEKAPRRPAPTPAEEKTMFLRYNYAKYRLSRLSGSLGKGKTPACGDQETLWEQRASQARDQIVHANLPLAPAMAKRMISEGVELGDLICEGQMAILRCIELFDVSRGFKFSTYACRAILACIHRFGTKERRLHRLAPVPFEPKMEKDDYDKRRHEEQIAHTVEGVREIVLRNHANLTGIERTVLLRRFPIGSEALPLTRSQIGKLVGLSKERIRQIEGVSLSKLRCVMVKHLVE